MPKRVDRSPQFPSTNPRKFLGFRAGDPCEFAGDYLEVEVNGDIVDRKFVAQGQAFPAVRQASNRWHKEMDTELQYKTAVP